jgi:tripartite-type tricarboxylate transporter receptor subunit TctC
MSVWRSLLRGAGRLGAAACVLLAVGGDASVAQGGAQPSFPNRPVQVLVGFPAGGGADLIARAIQNPLGAALGQPIVIRNVTGAGGTIAGQQVATGNPDGHLAILAPLGAGGVFLPHVRTIPYDLDALRPVCAVYDGPGTLMVAPDSPIRRVPDLIRLARERPGTLNYGSPGPGSPAHVVMAGFTRALGIEMEHVPFRGSADIAMAMRAGQVQVFADAYNIAVQLDLRPIAVFRREPLPMAPELEPMRDHGYDLEFSIHGGIFIPRGASEAVYARWQVACRAAVEAPESLEAFRRMAVLPMFLEGAAYAERLKREHVAVGEIVRAAGVQRQD